MKSEDTPVVSIVMPVKNGRLYIDEAMKSVLSGHETPVELVIVDDGSTDGTPEIVGALRDARVRLLTNTGAGVSSARNQGIAASTGRFLLFLDADDRLKPGAVDRLVAAVKPGDVGVYGDYDRIDARGRRLGIRHLVRSWRRKPTGDVLGALIKANFIAVGCAIVLRESVLAVGSFDPSLRLCEDWLLWCQIAALGTLTYVPGLHVCDYRMHRDSTMHRRAHKLADMLPVVSRIYSDPRIHSRFDPSDVAALRVRSQEALRTYVIMEAVRIGDWRAAADELSASQAGRLPRLGVRLAASWLGL